MPNWAEGNIRIRGKRQNVIHFLQEELKPLFFVDDRQHHKYGYEERPIEIEPNAGGYELILRKNAETEPEVYFCGSQRQFIDFGQGNEIIAEISDDHLHQRDDQVVFLNGFKGAWSSDDKYFMDKAVQHKVDIRIFMWEKGMEWSRVATWYRDGKYAEESRTYANWLWESALPDYGG